MASFNTHLAVGITVSGVAAIGSMVLGLAERADVIPWFLLGTLGSLLPDIDADYSTPLQITFTLLSIVFAFLIMFGAALHFSSLAELLLVWLSAYLVIRWGVFHLFTRYTTHRGIIHSLPAAAVFGLVAAIVAFWLFGQSSLQAWLAGGFVTLGFVTHLLLDEVSAINLFGIRSRRSFGSALKFWYGKSLKSTAAMYVALALFIPFVPPPQAALDKLEGVDLIQWVRQDLLPHGGWFEVQ